MNNIIKRVWNQNRMVNIEGLSGAAFQAEDGGHTFQISGIDDTGAAVAFSGTVAGVFRRPDNADIALTGSVSDGVASVTLTDDCYAVPGRFGLTIFVTSGGQKTAVYACIGTVANTSGGAVAGETPQDVVDLINDIAAAVATIPASYTDLMAAIAPTYSSEAVYAVGSYAWYNGILYRSKVPITTPESWTASHWTAVPLGEDLRNSLSFANGNLGSEFTFRNSANLVDKTTTTNTLVSPTGVESASDTYATSALVPVTVGASYYLMRQSADNGQWVHNSGYLSWYDEFSHFISRTGMAYSGTFDLSVCGVAPAGAKFCRVSAGQTVFYNLMLVKDATAFPAGYVEYNKQTLLAHGIYAETIPANGVNLLDIDTVGHTDGVYRSQYTGNIVDNKPGYSYTGIFYLPAGSYVTRCYKNSYGNTATAIGTAASDGTRTGRVDATIIETNGDNSVMTFTLAGGTYIWLNAQESSVESLMVCAGNTVADYPTYYVPYTAPFYAIDDDIGLSEKMKSEAVEIARPDELRSKIIALDGDSIVAGAGYSGGYGKLLGIAHQMRVYNIAVGGGTMAANTYQGTTARHWICRSITNMYADADYAIVEGGANDSMLGVTLGTLSSGYDATLDDTTFYGAVESVFKQMTIKFAGKKYGFIIPHQHTAGMNPGGGYYNAIMECAKKWGVPVLDLSVLMPPFGMFALDGDYDLLALRDAYTKTQDGHGDGIHPNEACYRKYYLPLIDSWLQSL